MNDSTHAGDSGIGSPPTRIASITPEQVTYRGYRLADLAERCSFEETAHLLIYGDLPNRRQRSLFHDTLMEYRRLPQPILEALRAVPTDADPIDVLRTVVSVAGHYDPTGDTTLNDRRRRSIWLLATVAAVFCARHRLANRQPRVEPQPGLSHAAQLLYQCSGKEPDASAVRVLDQLLVCSAEYGVDASTRAVRNAAQAGADMVSAMVAGIATLKGIRHPADDVAAWLTRLERPDETARYVAALVEKGTAPGFVRAIEGNADPRTRILDEALHALAAERGRDRKLEAYAALRETLAEKLGVLPTALWPAMLLLPLIGLPVEVLGPLLAVSRMAGWCAHYLEQSNQEGSWGVIAQYDGELPRDVPDLDAR